MQPRVHCPDCNRSMEEGFVPDATYGAYLQNHWHAGAPEKSTFFGLETGTKVVRTDMLPMSAWRCEGCGLVRFYARRG